MTTSMSIKAVWKTESWKKKKMIKETKIRQTDKVSYRADVQWSKKANIHIIYANWSGESTQNRIGLLSSITAE